MWITQCGSWTTIDPEQRSSCSELRCRWGNFTWNSVVTAINYRLTTRSDPARIAAIVNCVRIAEPQTEAQVFALRTVILRCPYEHLQLLKCTWHSAGCRYRHPSATTAVPQPSTSSIWQYPVDCCCRATTAARTGLRLLSGESDRFAARDCITAAPWRHCRAAVPRRSVWTNPAATAALSSALDAAGSRGCCTVRYVDLRHPSVSSLLLSPAVATVAAQLAQAVSSMASIQRTGTPLPPDMERGHRYWHPSEVSPCYICTCRWCCGTML